MTVSLGQSSKNRKKSISSPFNERRKVPAKNKQTKDIRSKRPSLEDKVKVKPA